MHKNNITWRQQATCTVMPPDQQLNKVEELTYLSISIFDDCNTGRRCSINDDKKRFITLVPYLRLGPLRCPRQNRHPGGGFIKLYYHIVLEFSKQKTMQSGNQVIILLLKKQSL